MIESSSSLHNTPLDQTAISPSISGCSGAPQGALRTRRLQDPPPRQESNQNTCPTWKLLVVRRADSRPTEASQQLQPRCCALFFNHRAGVLAVAFRRTHGAQPERRWLGCCAAMDSISHEAAGGSQNQTRGRHEQTPLVF